MIERTTLLVVVATLGSACAVATDEADPQVDESMVTIDEGKADGSGGEYSQNGTRLDLFGDAADALYGLLDDAGLRHFSAGGLNYVVGQHLACVTNGTLSSCVIFSRSFGGAEGDFLLTVHGRRFRSAASELFGALAAATGVAPSTVTSVEAGRFACGKDRYAVWCGLRGATPTLELGFSGLGDLGEDAVYEGWLITPDGPVSSGRFDAPAEGDSATFAIDATVASEATLFVLTIEPRHGDDPAPSETHVLAGHIEGGRASLTVDHPAALGTDFLTASGGFILETPSSSMVADDYDQGIWFLDPGAGPGPGLDLPVLPAGWVYEGWVVTGDGPVSTGRFTAVVGEDSDGAGPAAGPDGSPPFPGQDFVDPPTSVIGATVVISVEPMPDDSPAPFAIKPLVGDAIDAGAGGFQSLGSTGGDTLPTGVAFLHD